MLIPGLSILFIKLIFFLNVPHLEANLPVSPEESSNQTAPLYYNQLNCPELTPEAFLLAFEGYKKIVRQHSVQRDTILTIIDFSKPSTKERMFIIDIKNKQLIEKSLVAHGKGSGVAFAEHFSNTPHSLQSSLGFFITAKTYQGKHGYSLRIKGIEPGINSNAWQRAIVIHPANYVSTNFIEKYGRLGRSFGCPALPNNLNRKIIDLIKDSSCLFIYSPDQNYMQTSEFVNSNYYSQIIPE